MSRPVLSVVALLAALAGACGSSDTKLKVTGVEPDKGDVQGGTFVRIRGNRFTADGARNAKIYFGSRQGTVERFASDSEMIVVAPGGKANETVDLMLTFEPGGEIKIPKGFTFVDKSSAAPSVNDLNTAKPTK
jgi:hypothetical protein